MVIYTCNPCGKPFDHKSNYEKHINKKKPCEKIINDENKEQPNIQNNNPIKIQPNYDKNIVFQIINPPIDEDILIDDKNTTCCHCGNVYSKPCHLVRHYKTCFTKRQTDEKHQINIDLLKKKYDSEIDDLKHKYDSEINVWKHKYELLEISTEGDLKHKYETEVSDWKHKYELLKTNVDCELKLKNNLIQNLNFQIGELKNKSVKKIKIKKSTTIEITDVVDVIDNKTDVPKNIHLDKNISSYDGKNVFYMAYIGTINNENIYKYGISRQIFVREYTQHRNTFKIFNLIYLEETDNNAKIELLFEQNMKILDLHRNLIINNKKYSELFTTSDYHSIDKIIKDVTKLISENPLSALKDAQNKIKELTNDKEIMKLDLEYKILLEKSKHKEL